MKSLESCFPTMPFFNDLANSPTELGRPELSEESLVKLINLYYPDIKTDQSNVSLIFKTEPFASNKATTKKILNDMGLAT